MKWLSVLLPARPNDPYLKDALDSIKKQTVDFDSTEVIMAYDKEDTKALQTAKGYAPLVKPIPVDMSMRIFGLGKYTNEMVEHSSGALVWWLATDCLIKTYGYDKMLQPLARLYGHKVYRFFPMPDQGGGTAFPILTRKWLDTTRHWSLHSRIDSWISRISEGLPKDRVENPAYGLYIENTVITGKKEKLHAPEPLVDVKGDMHAIDFADKRVQERIAEDTDKLKKQIEDELKDK